MNISSVSASGSASGDQFDFFNGAIAQRFAEVLKAELLNGNGLRLFTTDTSLLWDAYLANLPVEERQHHNCQCCRHFIQRFGGLVAIDAKGRTQSAIWGADHIPELYQPAARALAALVEKQPVSGVFVSSDAVLGNPVTGEWTHFALVPPSVMRHTSRWHTAGQVAAQKREDVGTLSRALSEFSRDHIAQALTLLEAEALYRADKVIGPARWLLGAHDALKGLRGNARSNVLWRLVATAPVGFCTPRSAMIGTLLEDIAAGMDFAEVKRRFDAKMHPLQYQRPQAPASAGNIAQAEKMVAQLGLEPSLRRRFARLDEIQTIWKPRQESAAPAGGVFGHLKPKASAKPEPLEVPPQLITFSRFRRTVLAGALKIEFLLPRVALNFAATVTAADPFAPPILLWDTEEERNPFSNYVYNGGSHATDWGLIAGKWAPVTAVALRPHMWGGEDRYPNQTAGALFVLEGARDVRGASCGLALFPEILKSGLHAVRSTIESFSKSGSLEGCEEASANGVMISPGGVRGENVVRVTTANGVASYKIDRWD